MPIIFRHKRLFVGTWRTNWTQIWYQPISQAENELGVYPKEFDVLDQDDVEFNWDVGLFPSPRGGARIRDPMLGQVMWEPYFDPGLCESKVKKERERMWMQLLLDTYRLMIETEPARIEARGEALKTDHGHDPSNKRMALYKDAVHEKRLRRMRKMDKVQVRKIPEDEVDTDSDQGYGSQDESRTQPRGPRKAMQPPGQCTVPRAEKRSRESDQPGIRGSGSGYSAETHDIAFMSTRVGRQTSGEQAETPWSFDAYIAEAGQDALLLQRGSGHATKKRKPENSDKHNAADTLVEASAYPNVAKEQGLWIDQVNGPDISEDEALSRALERSIQPEDRWELDLTATEDDVEGNGGEEAAEDCM